jgi:hypothetical protein
MPNQLILQAAEETLSHRIVVAVALALMLGIIP